MIQDKDLVVNSDRDMPFLLIGHGTNIQSYRNPQTHCVMTIAIGEESGRKWATIYSCINNGERGKGHMSEMFEWFARSFREKGYVDLGCTIALKPQIKHLCKKHKIEEYR